MPKSKPKLKRAELLNKVGEYFQDFVLSYGEANPELLELLLAEAFYHAAYNLKHYLQDPEDTSVNWEHPFIELQHEADPAIRLELIDRLADEELTAERMAPILAEAFEDTKGRILLQVITGNIFLVKEGEEYTLNLPEEIQKEIEGLPEEEAFEIVRGYEDPEPLTLSLEGEHKNDETGETSQVKGKFWMRFHPLVIDPESERAFYPIFTGLEIETGPPLSEWSDEEREKLLEELVRNTKALIPEEKFPERPALIPIGEETFALPSHPLMFALIAMFAGKAKRIPRKLLEKPYSERTPEERLEAEEFLGSILETEEERKLSPEGKLETREKLVALVSNNPRVEARAEITSTLFSGDLNFREERLAAYIERTFGPEGLRHLLGLIIGLEENFRQGYFRWNVNEHLERLGYKKTKGGSYSPELKKTAIDILQVFTSLVLTVQKKFGKRDKFEWEYLFTVEGGGGELFENVITKQFIKLRATDFWYKNALNPQDGEAPQFTKLLRQIAKENHGEHPLAIYLTPLLAIFWRIGGPERKLTVGNLMEWCNLPTSGPHWLSRNLKNLEAELDYMKGKGYLGGWSNDGESYLPSDCEAPLDCVLTLSPPEWLEEELVKIGKGRERPSLQGAAQEPLTLEEFKDILEASKLSQRQFAGHLGISQPALNQILKGKYSPSSKVSEAARNYASKYLDGPPK